MSSPTGPIGCTRPSGMEQLNAIMSTGMAADGKAVILVRVVPVIWNGATKRNGSIHSFWVGCCRQSVVVVVNNSSPPSRANGLRIAQLQMLRRCSVAQSARRNAVSHHPRPQDFALVFRFTQTPVHRGLQGFILHNLKTTQWSVNLGCLFLCVSLLPLPDCLFYDH